MTRVSTTTPSTYKNFLERQEEAKKMVERSEHRFVRVVIDLFPDVFAVLELPIINQIPFVQTITKNIGPITVSVIVSSVGLSFISVAGVALTSGIVKISCVVIFINSSAVGSIFTLSMMQRYFTLRRNHQRMEIINHMVREMYITLETMEEQLATQKSLNEEQAATTAEQARQNAELKIQVGNIQKAAEELRHAPGNLVKVAAEVRKMKEHMQKLGKQIDDLQSLKTQLESVVESLKQQEKNSKAAHATLLQAQQQIMANLVASSTPQITPRPDKERQRLPGKENSPQISSGEAIPV
ncbi:hypothetical protein K0U07_00885 [bacterium]|nr:hypothetical protein [bacterium]